MATPRYLEIKQQLLDEINGKPANSPIASERELAIRFDASRMTVRNAVNELVEEGVLYRDKNKGTFVADRKLIKKNLTSELLQEHDAMDFSVIYFSVKKAEEMAPYLEIKETDYMLRVVRVNKINHRPLSVEEVYFIRSLVSDDEINHLKELLNLNSYIEQGTVTQRFHPMIVPAQYANQLKIKITTPIIMAESTIRSKNGKPLVYIKTFYNPFEKTIEITS